MTDRLPLSERLSRLAGQTAIVLLIDQSGSMNDRIVQLAGQVKVLADELEAAGVPAAITGFTTTSWRGGQSREAWRKMGKPKYPGRLCDLLHIIYKNFDETLERKDWEAMLDARALHENVDGEALEWAAGMLSERDEPNKLLIVVSDGAPVDDSTLQENGLEFMGRHLLQIIGQISADTSIQLGAVGIDFQVDRYYKHSIMAEQDNDFLSSFTELLDTLKSASVTT